MSKGRGGKRSAKLRRVSPDDRGRARRRLSSDVIDRRLQPKHRAGELGLLARDYPSENERRRIMAAVQARPEGDRTPDDWWILGEYQVYDGLLQEDSARVNEGLAALSRGASMPE